jgi:MFS family permease
MRGKGKIMEFYPFSLKYFQEGSWVASLSLLGALFGCLFGGLMLQLGRRRSLLIVALPFSGSWLLTVFAQRVEMMYSTSFIGGFFSAVTLLATQVSKIHLPYKQDSRDFPPNKFSTEIHKTVIYTM